MRACKFIFALCLVVGNAKHTQKPYLLGYHSSQVDNDMDIIPEYANFSAPRGPVPEWQKAINSARELLSRGEHHNAVTTIEGIINSPYNYGRMGSTARYSLHLSLGMCLLHGGLFSRAETAFYVATSLHDEPHEAHKGLALVSVMSGQWDSAFAHWKNSLFLATSQDSEYLQRLGALLILSGNLNEGRHYLSRAVSQWELAQGPGASLPVFQIGPKEYSWFIEYLVGTTALSWPPHGRFDNDVQSPQEWRLLSQLVADPSLLDASAFLQLSDMLYELGAYSESKFHLQHARSMAKDATLLASAELRLLLRAPWKCDRSTQRTIWSIPNTTISGNKDTITSSDEMVQMHKYAATLFLNENRSRSVLLWTHSLMSAYSARHREHQALSRPGRPFHAGLLLEADDTLLLATIPTMKQRGLDIVVFSTGAVPALEGVEVVILPMGLDWWKAASIIRSRLLSVLLFSDSCSSYFNLIMSQRVATHHVAVWHRGAPPPARIVDYYLQPEYFNPAANHHASQTVSVSGLGVAWSALSLPNVSNTPRYEFHGMVFFNYMHLILVTAPFSEYTSEMDEWIVTLLQADPQIQVLLLVNSFDLGGRAFPSQWQNRYLHHVRSKLGGDRDAHSRLKLMPYLNLEGRLALTRISKAVLDSPRGEAYSILEAMSLGTPVLTRRGGEIGMTEHFIETLKDKFGDIDEAKQLDRLVFNDTKGLSQSVKYVISEQGASIKKLVRKGFDSWSRAPGRSDIASFVGEELAVV